MAERIKEYTDLGIESFIFSGYPHLEEAYRFAELVFPLLPEPYASLAGRGITNLTRPFGEMIAERCTAGQGLIGAAAAPARAAAANKEENP